jgi:hypothetical protein
LIQSKTNKPSPVEKSLDLQIRHWLKRKDLLVKAVKYQKTNESAKINALIDKWRGICHQASNYLLNSMQVKIMHMGGYSTWKQQQKDKKINQSFDNDSYRENLSDFVNTEEFTHLSSYEQSDIMDQLNENSNQSILENETEETNLDDQLTMNELYRLLNINYDLIYN